MTEPHSTADGATPTEPAPPSSESPPHRRRVPWLGSWALVWAVTAAFVIAALALALSGRALHDEGVLTWHYASILEAEPIAGLFFQKLRPVLALLYAPAAAVGYRAFSIMHVLVGAAAIPLAAAIAERLGQRRFVVPALVLGSSPLLLMTAAGGHSNADIVTGLLLGLYLIHVKDRPIAGGAVLGALILVRSEVAPMLAVIAVGELVIGWRSARAQGSPAKNEGLPGLAKTPLAKALLAGPARPLMAMAIVPVVYVALGSLYHRDLLWALHYPPALSAPADSDWVEAGDLPRRVVESAEAMLGLSPAWGLVLLSSPRSLAPRERWLGLGFVGLVLLLRGLPMIGLFNFDTSPRYLLVALPALALLLGRQADTLEPDIEPDKHPDTTARWRPASWPGLLALAALGLLAGILLESTGELGPAPPLLAFVGVWALCLAGPHLLPSPHGARLALASCVVASLAATPLLFPLTHLAPPTRTLEGIATWWEREGEAQAPNDAVVITNYPLTKSWLMHEDLLGAPERIHLMLQHDMVYELQTLLDAEVGQDEAIFAALEERFYGRPILATDTRGHDPVEWPEGSVVIFVDDERLAETLDLELWHAHIVVEVAHDETGNEGLLIGRIVHTPIDADQTSAPASVSEKGSP